MNDRETLEVHLNVFGEFKPKLNGSHRDSKFVSLGNASPTTQLSVLDQVPEARLTVADTMDLWINIQRDELEAASQADRRARAQRFRGPAARGGREPRAGRACRAEDGAEVRGDQKG